MRNPIEIEFSKLAEIAMDSLPEPALNSLMKYLEILHHDLKSQYLQGRILKLRNHLGESIFTLRFSTKFRAIITIKENKVRVLDIVNHDELRKNFGKGGKYA